MAYLKIGNEAQTKCFQHHEEQVNVVGVMFKVSQEYFRNQMPQVARHIRLACLKTGRNRIEIKSTCLTQ